MNKIFISRANRGALSLLEIMFVLAFMAVIALGGLRQYQQYVVKQHTLVIKNSVQTLKFGLNNFYLTQCSQLMGLITTAAPADLVPGYLPNLNTIDNPLNTLGADAYTLTIDTTSTSPQVPWKLAVHVAFAANTSESVFNKYKVLLNPSTSNFAEKTMTWEFLPGLDATGSQSVMKAPSETFSVQERPGTGQLTPIHTRPACAALEYQRRHPR